MKNIEKNIVALIIVALLITACASSLSSTPEPIVTVYLNDLEPGSVSIGFSELGRGVNPFTEEKLIEGQPITAHNTTYSNGLFAHAPAQIEYKIDGAYSSISGYVLMHDGIKCGDGARFLVLADGREVYTSSILTSASEPVAFQSDLTGAQTLTLKVDAINDMECDWSVWGDPVLTNENKPLAAAVESTSTLVTLPTETLLPTATIPPTVTPAPILPNHPGWMPDGAVARFGMGTYGGMALSKDNAVAAIVGTGGVHLFDPLTAKMVDFLETGVDPYDVTFSPDGKKLFVSLGFSGVAVWNHESGSWSQEAVIPVPCAVVVRISPNGEILFAKCYATNNNRLVAWDMASSQQLYQFNYTERAAFTMTFSPVDPNLMAVSADYTVTLMDVKGGRTISTYYEPNKNKVLDLDFSPDGSTLAITAGSTDVILLDVASASESGRSQNISRVLQFSFIDNQTFIVLMDESTAVKKVNGDIVKRLNYAIPEFPFSLQQHVYVPERNLLVFEKNGGGIVSASLDIGNITGEVGGFNFFSLYEASITEDGEAFIVNDTLIIRNDPANFIYLNTRKACNDPYPPNQFIDPKGEYIYLWCGDNKLLVVKLSEAMNVVASFDRPLSYEFNTNLEYHPWADERPLFALMYQNTAASPAKYRIEVWDPIQKKKVSVMNVDIPEFKPLSQEVPRIVFSPSSKYLVVMPVDGRHILSYDVASGELIQDIQLVMPRTIHPTVRDGVFSNDDTTFFLRHDDFVEAYSVESGAFIQRVSGLRLVKWNTCEGFCPEDINTFAYYGETGTFVNYYVDSTRDDMLLSVISHDLESGQKTSTASIQLPYIHFDGSKVDRSKWSLMIKMVYLPMKDNGNTAVVAATVRDKGIEDSTLYLVDIPSGTILKTYTWRHSAWNISFLPFNDFLLVRQSPTPLYFLWDISAP